MNLQLKNLKLTVDHASVVRDLSKRAEVARLSSPVRRDNRYQTNNTVKRLELELEKTARQLQNELIEVQSEESQADQNFEGVSIQLLEEVETLFARVDEYF